MTEQARKAAKTALKKRTLKAVTNEDREKSKGQDGYNKRSTSLKTSKLAEGTETGVTTPTSEELAAINTYTRTPKTADEVAVFRTMSCNDLEDRDEDKFTTDTVKEFASLPVPYGPNGKSYMVGHDYSKLPVGRIFDTDTTKVEDALFLTNGVYVPRTPQYETFLENQDFGIYWAVSVGVMLDSNECSICAMPMMRWFAGCYDGHYKGAYYLPSDERDKSGWPIEAEPGDAGAIKCLGLMKGARDFYELSQVFLGAQFYAELSDKSKSPELAGVIKSAGSRHIPIIGLSAKEAGELPSLALDSRVSEALQRYKVEHDVDGDLRWTDADGFRWLCSAGEVLMLGKSPSTEDGGTDGGSGDQQQGRKAADDGEPLGEPDAEQLVELGADGSLVVPDDQDAVDQPADDGRRSVGDLTDKVAAARERLGAMRAASTDDEGTTDPSVAELLGAMDEVVDQAEQDLTDGDTDAVASALDSLDSTIDDIAEDLGVTFDDPDDDTTDGSGKQVNEEMSKKAVLAAAVRAKVPASVLTKVSEAPDNGLSVLLGALTAQNAALESEKLALASKAALGDEYIKSVRKDALDWYVKANSNGNKGVNVDTFTKVLDACGDNVELVLELQAEQEKLAKTRFGVPTVRATAVTDPHERPEVEGLSTTPTDVKHGSDATVRKLHG